MEIFILNLEADDVADDDAGQVGLLFRYLRPTR